MKSLATTSALCLLAISCALVACESAVNPIIGSDLPFTMWGFMNSGADTQYVRVFPISGKLLIGQDDEIDAQVFSFDLTTGEKREWMYKKVLFDSTSAGHLFWSPFRAEYEHSYRVEVVRSDGETSRVEVTVPPEVDVAINVDEVHTIFPLTLEGAVPNIIGAKVTYHTINVPPAPRMDSDKIHPPVLHPVTISYDEKLQRDRHGWSILIDLVRDEETVRTEFRNNCLITPSVPNIWLQSMEFTAVLADSSWNPPGGAFDPDQLVVPGTMSNVENGYGFMGAGEGVRILWAPSIEARQRAGYRPETSCAAGPAPEECTVPVVPPIPCIGERAQDIWQLFLR